MFSHHPHRAGGINLICTTSKSGSGVAQQYFCSIVLLSYALSYIQYIHINLSLQNITASSHSVGLGSSGLFAYLTASLAVGS